MSESQLRDVSLAAVKACVYKYRGIGLVRNVCVSENGPFHNTVYLIETEKGRFFLKVLSTHWYESTEARYEYISAVMERVAALGVKVPLPIRNDDGRILTGCGHLTAVLSEEVCGEPFQRDNLEHTRAAGCLLGAFHKATSDFLPSGTSWIGDLGSFFILDASFLELLPANYEGHVIREYHEEVVKRSRDIESELAAVNYSQLQRAVIHSEYVVKHLRMMGNRVIGLLDFEYTSRDARAIDVALALEDFPCSSRGARDFDYERVQAFVSGYNSAGVPLLGEEISSFPALLKSWCVDSIGYWVRRVARTGERIVLFDLNERIKQDFQYLDWWSAHGDKVVAGVARVLK